MKKILFVANTLQFGGAERILINILKNIDKTKYDITVLALVNYGVLVDEVKNIEGTKYIGGFKGLFNKTKLNEESKIYKIQNKIMIKKLKRYTKELRTNSNKLYKKFVKEKYDVEIAFLEGRVSKFVSCSTNPKSKKISWIHTDITNITPENFINVIDEKKSYSKFDKIVCVSNGVKEKFQQKTGITKNLYVQINPIDSNNILKRSNEKINIIKNTDDIILCAVGRLEPVKGFDRLLEVHQKLIKQSIKHKLWIVGDGTEREKLENYVKNNNLTETVTLFGYDSNPYKFMKNADIYVCSSITEGLSSTVIEALILEKIILSTDCPGMREILGPNNDYGMIVENSSEGLYNGIKELITNESLRNQYKENIKKISNQFNLETRIKQIEEIIDT